MENCTIYYDDMNRHCRQYAESLSSHPNVVCKKCRIIKRPRISMKLTEL